MAHDDIGIDAVAHGAQNRCVTLTRAAVHEIAKREHTIGAIQSKKKPP